MLNGAGEKTNVFTEIDVTITQNAEDALLLMNAGYGKFIRNGDVVDINFSELELENGYSVAEFEVYVITGTNLWIEEDCGITYQLSNKKLAKVSDNGKYLLLSPSIPNGYELKVQVCTNLTRSDGSLFTLEFTMKIVK